MNLRQNLLWVDGLGAALAGVAMLTLKGWLSELYDLPEDLLVLMGIVNLAYASYSTTLAWRRRRPMPWIWLLVAANLTWAIFFCFRWALAYADTASLFGMAHLVGEGLYVGGLGCLEWRWRKSLATS